MERSSVGGGALPCPYCQVWISGSPTEHWRTDAPELDKSSHSVADDTVAVSWNSTEFTLDVSKKSELLHLVVFEHLLFKEDRPLGEVILPVERLLRLCSGGSSSQQWLVGMVRPNGSVGVAAAAAAAAAASYDDDATHVDIAGTLILRFSFQPRVQSAESSLSGMQPSSLPRSPVRGQTTDLSDGSLGGCACRAVGSGDGAGVGVGDSIRSGGHAPHLVQTWSSAREEMNDRNEAEVEAKEDVLLQEILRRVHTLHRQPDELKSLCDRVKSLQQTRGRRVLGPRTFAQRRIFVIDWAQTQQKQR